MSIFKRAIQGGIIRRYVVISVILAVVTIAAVYAVQQRGQQARRDQAIAAANELAKQASQPTDTANIDTPSDSTTPVVSTDIASNTSAPTSTPQPTPAAQSVTELPVTGSANDVLQVAVLALVTFSIVSYVLSRRGPVRSL